jgi:hypothetical protein
MAVENRAIARDVQARRPIESQRGKTKGRRGKSSGSERSNRMARRNGAGTWTLVSIAAAIAPLAASLAGRAENPHRDPKGEVTFQGRTWVSFADKAEASTYQAKEALHVSTKGGGMVYLKDAEIADGIIEADIAKGPFTGIVFRGQDSQHADCIYFRPQAAVGQGEARDHVVQHCAWGDPKTEWSHLRKNFPGKYEAYADVPADGWFHARLELNGLQIKVFVNHATKPCLIVEKALSGQARGKLGLWAWDGYFSNLTYSPAVSQPSTPLLPDLSGAPAERGWRLVQRTASVVETRGRKALRLEKPRGGSVGLAIVNSASIGDCEIEAEMLADANIGLGVAFGLQDERTYEAVYFRPFAFQAAQAGQRQEAVQYCYYPKFDFGRLRKEHPGAYEKDVSPGPPLGGWFRARIRVDAETVTVHVNNATEPCLVAKRLNPRQSGNVALWVGNGCPGEFASLKVTPVGK